MRPEEEITQLRNLCATLYQVLGAHDASEEVLDAVVAAARGEYVANTLDLLPYTPPSATPIPVTKRLPGAEDCDDLGRCWYYRNVWDEWHLRRLSTGQYTHWLPYWAIPLPEDQS